MYVTNYVKTQLEQRQKTANESNHGGKVFSLKRIPQRISTISNKMFFFDFVNSPYFTIFEDSN